MTRNNDRGHLLTEQRNTKSHGLDAMSVTAAFDVMNAEDQSVPLAVAKAKPAIVKAIKLVTAAWNDGGRLIYVGAGTSGRLGVLDASECPPTFRSDPKMVRGVIAGGKKALWRSVEGAEDEPAAAKAALRELKLSSKDVVMGIASGGTTPYVHAALDEARKRKAGTIFFACVPASQVHVVCDADIRVLTGPEVLTGSTRLKAGTATKLVLNMITTLSMVGIGKTYGNLMVDLNTYACRKLVDRATRVVQSVTGLDRAAADALLKSARGRAKTAIVMQQCGLDRMAAERLLKQHGGRVTAALGSSGRCSG
ncbi:MAG: N-acetylmuramic acid 6-phosphate etherase [Phycisphaerales bacterium]|nr:N-acetylmuramic acid 6-phosphate etherase [Phycisphaerales bacterium]MCB9856001.1 N-acetylmuramic acid 6-phosphate etherase [Phycisphaerales bacterium]MCB9864972.1 N-acetylmuramic acid 6-phosphate etherase [Phycisphaerales bacterium]